MTTAIFGQDELQRKPFADRVVRYAIGLCDQDVLPAGRVLAIDAPWGSGKSWLALRLVERLGQESEVTPIYINAFEFDYHHDPFSVLLSAILAALRGKQSNNLIDGLKDAGAAVINAATPKGVAALFSAAGSALIPGGAALIESIGEALGDASREALKTYENVRKTNEAFRTELKRITTTGERSGSRLIVIIDELDRCRPTFALEMLERIKHLFDVQNLAFILSIHKPALQAAIEHTYGASIEASLYLRKFISLEIPLPNSTGRQSTIKSRANHFRQFLYARFGQREANNELYSPIAQFAAYFPATLRDIEYIMLLSKIAPPAFDRGFPAVYALLLWMFDKSAFEAARRSDSQFFEREYQRLIQQTSEHTDYGRLMAQAFATQVNSVTHQNSDPEHANIATSLRQACLDLDLGQLRI